MCVKLYILLSGCIMIKMPSFFQKALTLSGAKFGVRPAPSTKGVSTAVRHKHAKEVHTFTETEI